MDTTITRPSAATITNVPPCPIPCATASTTCVMPSPKMKRIFASKICRIEFTPERTAMVRNHPAPRRMRRITGMRGSIAAGGADVLTGVPPGLSDMFAPCNSVRPVVSCCPDGSCGVKLPAKLSLRAESRRITRLLLCGVLWASPFDALAQEQHEDEIVANLAGGRAIVHVAKDVIVFAAIDQPVERNSIPPRVMDLDGTHIGVLFGASEWRIPSDPKPIRLDRNLQHVTRGDPRYQSAPGEGETDLETIGIAFLEKLRPLVSQLHHKLDFSSDEPIFQIVIIGYAPTDDDPKDWVVEYRMEQEQVATRGDYCQKRVQRPGFSPRYPPQ